ncbi:MAG TPA: hypothetical protein VFU46_12380 [Gemmatimonadales bacterium]|nr:hypothetical protein [Gemmatimonadales bacterium]
MPGTRALFLLNPTARQARDRGREARPARFTVVPRALAVVCPPAAGGPR